MVLYLYSLDALRHLLCVCYIRLLTVGDWDLSCLSCSLFTSSYHSWRAVLLSRSLRWVSF